MEKKIKKVKVKSESVESKPVIKHEEKPKNLRGFILMFKVVGHTTWRMQPYGQKEDLDKYLAMPGQANHAKITEKKWFVIDRVEGTITEE